MMLIHKIRWTMVVVLLAASMTGCHARPANLSITTGRMLLWHSYDDTATAVLEDILARFAELNPDVIVKTQRFATEDELMTRFVTAGNSGLGPDALIVDSSHVLRLVEADAIRPLDGNVTGDIRDQFMDGALTVLELDGDLYGLPLTLNTTVLFYNRDLVTEPAQTLDALIADAAAGNYVAMDSDFVDSFWGVATFGGDLLDADGRVILDQGGFANWLEWLKTVRDMPSFILDSDEEFLRSQFVGGDAAYLIASSQLFSLLQAELGDYVGAALLPSGPVAGAAPFLTADSMLLSAASSPQQADLAVTLAKFIANTEQSATFLRRTQRAVANENVRINPRLNPATSVMAAQARNALPLPNIHGRNAAFADLDTAQTRVLEGLLVPAVAAVDTTRTLNGQLGFEQMDLPERLCTATGAIRVVNALPEDLAAALDDVTGRFREVCPTVLVELISMSPAEVETLGTVLDTYDLVAGPQDLLTVLVNSGRVQELSTRAEAERLQRYWPQTLAAMRVADGLYGLPLAADTLALYVNTILVDQPARSLDELQRQALDGIPVVLEAGFVNAFWGISAFSTQPPATGPDIILDTDAVSAWLNWLKVMEDDARASIVYSHQEAREAFLDGASGYFVGTLADFPTVAAGLGEENLDVVTLPSGPGGSASPLLRAVGFMLMDRVSEGEISAVAEYTRYITDAGNQGRLVQDVAAIPANTSTDLANQVFVAQFVEQMQTATVMPNVPHVDDAFALGDQLYRQVLQDDVDLSTVMTETLAAISTALSVEPTATPVP